MMVEPRGQQGRSLASASRNPTIISLWRLDIALAALGAEIQI
jgi:hypothetical protein